MQKRERVRVVLDTIICSVRDVDTLGRWFVVGVALCRGNSGAVKAQCSNIGVVDAGGAVRMYGARDMVVTMVSCMCVLLPVVPRAASARRCYSAVRVQRAAVENHVLVK